jgi:hypothetical protein
MAKYSSDYLSLSSAASNPYYGTHDVDMSSTDQIFDPPVRGLLITVSGNIKVQFDGDGSIRTIPIVVGLGHYDFRGFLIRKLFKTGTTATVLCGLK